MTTFYINTSVNLSATIYRTLQELSEVHKRKVGITKSFTSSCVSNEAILTQASIAKRRTES
jgi:hypothetical protein